MTNASTLITEEEIKTFLILQEKLHAAAFEAVKEYSKLYPHNTDFNYLNKIDEIDHSDVKFVGWRSGYGGGCDVDEYMPLRFIFDLKYRDEYKQQLEEDRLKRVAKELEDIRLASKKAEEAEKEEYLRLKAKFEGGVE